MRIRILAPTPFSFSILLSSALAAPAMAQSAGPVSFDVTESALAGTVTCLGGSATTVAPVDASTTDVTGSNDSKAINLSATACGLPLYSFASADDDSSAQDTASQDDGDGGSSLSNVSLLGGLVTYQSKTETDACNDSGQAIACQSTTSIQNLNFAGQHITGTFTSATQFPAVSVMVKIPGYCTGAALFTGTLTLDDSLAQANGNTETITATPLALKGTLTCVGLPLTSMSVALLDNYSARCTAAPVSAVSKFAAVSNVPPTTIGAILTAI